MSKTGNPDLAPERKSAAAARVVRAEDWTASPTRGMAAFAYPSFRGSARGNGVEPDAAEQARLAQEEKVRREIAERKAQEDAVKSALAQGLERGRIEGEATARRKYDQAAQILKKEIESMLAAWQEQKAGAFLKFESQAADLLAFSLRRVFGSLAGNFPEAVLPVLRHAVAELGKASSLTIKVNPQELPLVEERRDFWLHLDMPADGVRCAADERVPRGGCRVTADATTSSTDLEDLGNRLAAAIEAACEERKRGKGAPEPRDPE